LTTFTILSDIASNIAGDRLVVKSITKPGAEIHSYQFTPSDIVKAKGAKLILENGLGLESWISKFTSSMGNIPKVKLTDGLDPLLIDDDLYAGKPNPHAWMSPNKAEHYVDKIVDAFIKIDPLGEDEYRENASSYKAKLSSLDKELRDSLSLIPKERRFLVTCEGAFSYLARDYGMQQGYLWPVNAEKQVTPRRMVNLIELIKENDIPTIFCESTVSAEAQKEVAKASNSVFGGTFYVDSLSNSDGPASTFLDLQRYNVQLLIKGLTNTSLKKE
jgi:manganese transport system substrate-binding protein